MTFSPDYIRSLRDITPSLPELPEQRAYEILERAEAWERQLIGLRQNSAITLDAYRLGAANYPDEVRLLSQGGDKPLMTAEHATDVVRKATGKLGNADHGTGAITAIFAEDGAATSIIPVGRQTGNAAVDMSHPIKDVTESLLPIVPAYLSVHGMKPGKVTSPNGGKEVHAVIGLGNQPGEMSLLSAEKLQSAAKDIGLKALIGNTESHYSVDLENGDIERDEKGSPKSAKLAALGAGSMVNFANSIAKEHNLVIPVMQLEITRSLRLIPEDLESGWHKDRRAKALGVYMGYLLVEKMIESTR